MYTYIQRIRLERTFVLGCDLELGVSRQDDAQALEWTLRAAWNGLANAQFSAGTLCPHCASTTSMRKEKTAPTCKCWFVPSRLGRVLPWNTDKCSPSSAFKSRYFEGKGAAVDYNRSFFGMLIGCNVFDPFEIVCGILQNASRVIWGESCRPVFARSCKLLPSLSCWPLKINRQGQGDASSQLIIARMYEEGWYPETDSLQS